MTYLVYPEWISIHRWGITGHPQISEIRTRALEGAPADYLPTEKEHIACIRKSIAPLRWDVACGALVLLLVTASFMVAGAAVLHPRIAAGEIAGAFQGWSLLTEQAWIWKNIHPSLVWVYYVCILAALWGTLQAYPEIYTRGIREYGRAIAPNRSWQTKVVQRWVCLFVLVVSTAVVWSDWDFHLMTLVVAFLATNVGITIAIVAALYLNFQLPPAYRTRWWMLLAGILSSAILLFVSVIAGIGVWSELQAAFASRF